MIYYSTAKHKIERNNLVVFKNKGVNFDEFKYGGPNGRGEVGI